MTAMSTWDNAPTLLLWSQNVEPPVLVRLEYLGYCGVLGMLKIWFSFFGTGGRIDKSGVASAAFSCCATAVASLLRPLCSCGRKMSNLRFSSGSNIWDIVGCLEC
jgi:hypothetical protein